MASKVIKNQADLLSRLEKAQINFKKSPKGRITKQYLETRIKNLEDFYLEFKRNHTELIQIVTSEQLESLPYFIEDDYNKFEEIYIDHVTELKEKLEEVFNNPIPTSNTMTSDDVRTDDDFLKRFWELEAEPDMIVKKFTREEQLCEELYEKSTVQGIAFEEEIKVLENKKDIPKRSPLRTLCPILDRNGILRVGGRIDKAHANHNTKHPIIMPAKSHLTQLLISDAHEKTLHGGPQIMINYIRTKYWIVRCRDLVKQHYRKCLTCLRYSKASRVQLMGQLPDTRLKPCKPFTATGVDYAGPVNIKFSPGRGAKSYKGYICLFVCMVTRAIHIEAVTDLTAKGFIAAFRRFTSRRGRCQDLFSDNGTNFVGADKHLREMFDSAKSSLPNEIAELLTLEFTTWHFIPPQSPNFGGIWEAGVRCAKNHLKRVIGDSILTYEELATVLSQIEACLNSRPISVISSEADDPLPLTPASGRDPASEWV
ncbi:uncharacterized protein LOC123697024 [Colias croceus]|uniref:uncharacterized protein LOC123697024 n=1 Tax=Colias crocea TaxID=72248 RepID=UPI001E27A2FA|nr:uncharacterized protein LOC123697024 [Colias croceus]